MCWRVNCSDSLFIQVPHIWPHNDGQWGEALMNIQSIVVLSIIFSLAINAISLAGIGPLSATTVNPFQGAAQCPTVTRTGASSNHPAPINNITCHVQVSGFGALLDTVLTFGIFLWGVFQLLPLIVTAILLPAAFLYSFGPSFYAIADIFTAAFLIQYLYFAYTLVTGRYNADIS